MIKPWVPVVAAVTGTVAVVALVAAVSAGSGGGPPYAGGGAAGPPVLHLAAGLTPDSASRLTAGAPAGTNAGGYRLEGRLPTGPASARLVELSAGAADLAVVKRLAAALGKPAPVRGDRLWRAGNLVVRDAAGQPWSSNQCGPDTPVASERVDAPCSDVAIAGSSGGVGVEGAPAPPVPSWASPPGKATKPLPPVDCVQSEQSGPCPTRLPKEPRPIAEGKALAAARPVLVAVGLAAETPQVRDLGGIVEVSVNPTVDGRPTAEVATRVLVGPDGSITSASGQLTNGRAGASYPLVSAQQAFDALPPTPRILAACMPVAGCPKQAESVLTGATLGLFPALLRGDRQVLLPAWLFQVKGQNELLAQMAVQRRFLADPNQPSTIEPTHIAPPPPVDLPTGSSDAPSNDLRYSLSADSRTLTLHTFRGVCPDRDDTATADEKGDLVVVHIARRPPSDGICVALAKTEALPVQLSAPLGMRRVVDEKGHPLPRI